MREQQFHSSTLPGFRAVLECMLDIQPRTTLPEFNDVAISRHGTVLGLTTCWHEVLEDASPKRYKTMTKNRLIELILGLCHDSKCEPQERAYLLQLLGAMEEKGKAL